MSLDRKERVRWWRPIFRALDPLRELRLHEIEALYAERKSAPYEALATDLAIADQPASIKVILCGARGSGKSTELTRLASELSEDFCVVHTDLAAGLPDEASTLAVLTLLGVAGLHAIASWSGPDGDQGNAEVRSGARLDHALSKFGGAAPKVAKLLGGISGIVTVFNPAVGAALATAGAVSEVGGAVASAGVEMRLALARGPLEGRLAADKRDDAKAVMDAVNEILDELAELSGRPPLLLADGLDKRTGVEEVELALAEDELLRGLRAPLVLTGPVNLRHDPRFRAVPGQFRLALLYNVPVRKRGADGTVHVAEDGVALLRGLYERRRIGADLPVDLFADGLVDRAAVICSGIIREFLGLLAGACKQAFAAGRTRVEAEDLDAAIKIRRLEMQGYLDEHLIDILGRVLDKGVVPAGPDADTLLFENFIACYPNGDIWFRPHELIVDYVAEHRERR